LQFENLKCKKSCKLILEAPEGLSLTERRPFTTLSTYTLNTLYFFTFFSQSLVSFLLFWLCWNNCFLLIKRFQNEKRCIMSTMNWLKSIIYGILIYRNWWVFPALKYVVCFAYTFLLFLLKILIFFVFGVFCSN
jgi:hypothetical protein